MIVFFSEKAGDAGRIGLVCRTVYRRRSMGKANKKQIDCPATGKTIRPAECGENRNSNYDCPATCPHNPWNPDNYDKLLEIENKTREKFVSRLKKEQISRYGYVREFPVFNEPTETARFFINKLNREPDQNGKTFLERWADEGFDGLKNDEQVALLAEAQPVASVLEIRQVLDDRRVLARDCFSDSTDLLELIDRSFAARACRFSSFLTLHYPTPGCFRLHSVGIAIPTINGIAPSDVVLEIANHLKAPKNRQELQRWLLDNLTLIGKSIQAVQAARMEAAYRTMDAAYSKTDYELLCRPGEFANILEQKEEIHCEEPPPEARKEGFADEWVWTEDGSAFGAGRAVLGRILIHPNNTIRLETTSAKRRDKIRPLLEKLLDGKIRFIKQRTDDMAKQIANGHRFDCDKSLVPKSLLGNPMQIETSCACLPSGLKNRSRKQIEMEMMKEMDRTFIKQPLPALDGKTPEEAARDQKLRPKLVLLMKDHICSRDEMNLTKGTSLDINETVRKLGLDELDVPPPPRRPVPCENRDEEFEDADDEFFDEEPSYLTKEEIKERWTDLDAYAPLTEKLQDKCPVIIDLLNVFFDEGRLPRVLYAPILELTAKITFTIVHPNIPFINLSEADMIESAKAIIHEEKEASKNAPFPSEEPVLLDCALDHLKRIIPKDAPRAPIAIFFMALIDSLHILMVEVMSRLLDNLPEDFFAEE
jgi:hypothetical protein